MNLVATDLHMTISCLSVNQQQQNLENRFLGRRSHNALCTLRRPTFAEYLPHLGTRDYFPFHDDVETPNEVTAPDNFSALLFYKMGGKYRPLSSTIDLGTAMDSRMVSQILLHISVYVSYPLVHSIYCHAFAMP
jgi:hypothetical protein